jgi:hypothetical protein
MSLDIKEIVIVDHAKRDKILDVDEISSDSQEDLIYSSTVGYVADLSWTVEEETSVRNKIDLWLMSFVLLMTFVLNMDRTNICKFGPHIPHIPENMVRRY